MQDLIGADRVVSFLRILDVGDFSVRRRDQTVALEQLACGQCDCVVSVGRSVIDPGSAGCGDGDLTLAIGHGQLAIFRGDLVVVRVASGEFIARDGVADGRSRIADGARGLRGDRILSDQAGHIVSIPALLFAVVYEGFILRFDSDLLRRDRKRSGNCCDVVACGHILAAVHDPV